MKMQFWVKCMNNVGRFIAKFEYFFITHFYRVHVNHKKNIKFLFRVTLNSVDDFVRCLNTDIVRYLCVNCCHTAIWSIVVND